jgi:hypothetical protein
MKMQKDENDRLLRKVSRLILAIKQLEERIKQIDILDELDLVDLYNDLVEFVQGSLNVLALEKLDNQR